MLFGIAGGIGIGVFAFFYVGARPIVLTTSGVKIAEQQLRVTLDQHGPCVAWVDMATLPHRAMPASWQGGAYHVITIYEVDAASESALVGNLTDGADQIASYSYTLASRRRRRSRSTHRVSSSASGWLLAPAKSTYTWISSIALMNKQIISIVATIIYDSRCSAAMAMTMASVDPQEDLSGARWDGFGAAGKTFGA